MTNDGEYRGAPLYTLVLAELVTAARYRGLTTYQHIAAIHPQGADRLYRTVACLRLSRRLARLRSAGRRDGVDSPVQRTPSQRVVSKPVLGGLHHEYRWAA